MSNRIWSPQPIWRELPPGYVVCDHCRRREGPERGAKQCGDETLCPDCWTKLGYLVCCDCDDLAHNTVSLIVADQVYCECCRVLHECAEAGCKHTSIEKMPERGVFQVPLCDAHFEAERRRFDRDKSLGRTGT